MSSPTPTEKELIGLTAATPLLDFRHSTLQALIKKRGWQSLEPFERIGAVYYFVRDEINFGYNIKTSLAHAARLVSHAT